MRRALPIVALIILSACGTSRSKDWTGGASTPFIQAAKSCDALTASIKEEANRRDFYVGCMASLGWTPKPGATIEI